MGVIYGDGNEWRVESMVRDGVAGGRYGDHVLISFGECCGG